MVMEKSVCYAVEIFSRHGLCPLVPLPKKKYCKLMHSYCNCEKKNISIRMEVVSSRRLPSTYHKIYVNGAEVSKWWKSYGLHSYQLQALLQAFGGF